MLARSKKPGDVSVELVVEHPRYSAKAELPASLVQSLAEVNGLKSGAILQPNQTLNLPAVKSAQKPAAPAVVQDSRKAAFLAVKAEDAPKVAATATVAGTTYTVVKGDTPTSIAKRFGMTAPDLLKLNKIDDPKKMQIGQTLKVPAKKN